MNSKDRKHTLSLCMIVKDEEAFLGQCLASVQNAVDEMIIVDTGSADRTVEIAESYGAQVYHHPWQGSFSEARNYGLQFATGDWILQMDADEELEREDIPIIKKVIQSDLYDAIFVALLSDTEDGWAKHYFQRIFRRGKARYEGIVHNQLKYEGATLNTEIRIYHWGYNLSKEKMDAKLKRSEKLLLMQLSQDKTDPFAHHNYLRILRAQERYEDAVQQGQKALRLCEARMGKNHHQMIAYDTAHCLMIVGSLDESESVCREILKTYPKNLDMLFTLGTVLMNQKRPSESISVFKRFLEVLKKEKDCPEPNQLIVDSYNFDHRAWGFISKNYIEMEAFEKAKYAAEKAIELRPEQSTYLIMLAEALIRLDRKTEAQSILQNASSKQWVKPEFYIHWAALYKQYSEMGDTWEIILQGLKSFPESDELHNSLAYSLYEQDQEKAEMEWLKALEIRPDHMGAHLGLARLYGSHGRVQALENEAEHILKCSSSRDVLKKIGGYCLHARSYQKAIELFSKFLTMDPSNIEVLSDIATCYAKMGQYEAALVGYREALRFDPQNVSLMKNLRGLQRLVLNEANS